MSTFSVCQFFDDGSYEYVRRNVPAEEAVTAARHYCNSISAQVGLTKRVIITDDDDCIVFEWKEGTVIFPPNPGR